MTTEPPQRNKTKFLPAFLLLLSLSVIILPTRPAYACSCARPSAPNQALADATVVFSADEKTFCGVVTQADWLTRLLQGLRDD